MASGIDVAGFVLAVLPLVVEAAKAYSKGAKTIKDVLLPHHRDEQLEEFYEDLWWEMHMLSSQLRLVVDALPGLSDDEKTKLETGLRSDDHKTRSLTTGAFRDYFGSDEDLQAFDQLIDKIARLLSRMIDNGYTHVSTSDMTSVQLLKKLRTFVKSREHKKTTSTLKERLNLRMKEKDLHIRVANLQKWNQRLGKLIKQAQRQRASSGSTSKQISRSYKRPSTALSSIPQLLYHGLLSCWDCSCQKRHEAQLCLRLPYSLHRDLDPDGIDFDLLLSVPDTIATPDVWSECSVHVRNDPFEIDPPTSMPTPTVTIQAPSDITTEGTKISEVCNAALKVYRQGHRLCLLAKCKGIRPEVWRVRSQKRQLDFTSNPAAISLASSLSHLSSLSLTEKRGLALTLAEALLLLDGSPWLEERWTKNEISFFKTAHGLDLSRPYVSSLLDQTQITKRTLDLDVLHPNLSILSLGVLLIELETGVPLEAFRQPDDLTNGAENDNTDYTVADRVAKALSNCTPDYQEAIFACLDVPWKQAGKPISLGDPQTRSGVYETIISRLEQEMESLGVDLARA